jgi:hypothetical protein
VDRNALIATWYIQLPNFILAVLMYTMLARVILGLMVAPDSPNYIWRFFCRVTDPVVSAVAAVTPKACPPVIIWLFAVVWIFWLRLILFIVFSLFGLGPPSGASP